MKDIVKPCHHCVSEDAVYKEVVVIGNGPSGIITSLLLSGRSPQLLSIPEDLPLDPMLRARLEPHVGRELLDLDLHALAEGLEGRSQNPLPLLMDNLLNPCADLGVSEEPLVEWKYDVERQVEHVVLGKGPPGGAWHGFHPAVLTLSPSGWLALPPHTALPGRGREERAPAGQVAEYYAKFVRSQGLQRYFRSGVVVTGVAPRSGRTQCESPTCPQAAKWCVTGYDMVHRRVFRYQCARVVLACGASDRPNTLAILGASHALHDLARRDEALATANHEDAVLVVGSGLSAADAVSAARRAGRRVAHAYRTRATALAGLSPHLYPDYCEVYKMMRDGTSGNHTNYIPLPEHAVIEITPVNSTTENITSRKHVKLLNLSTNQIVEITVSVVFILIGSKPDLHFLPADFDLNIARIETRQPCPKCNGKHAAKRKMEERQCFFKDRWHYIKSVVGQGIQSCKSRYWDYVNDSEINGNANGDCVQADCKRDNIHTDCKRDNIHMDCKRDNIHMDCKRDYIHADCNSCIQPECKRRTKSEGSQDTEGICKCQLTSPHSSGIGFGVDPKKPIDCRKNPIYIDKSTHEVVNAPKGIYALGPLTSDNFVRFISGGAVAAVAHMWRERKLGMTD